MAVADANKGKEDQCFKLIHVNCVFSALTENHAPSPGPETLFQEKPGHGVSFLPLLKCKATC